jgi:hypothetical protein
MDLAEIGRASQGLGLGLQLAVLHAPLEMQSAALTVKRKAQAKCLH